VKKLLVALALSTSMLGAAPLYAEDAAPAAVTTAVVAAEQAPAAPVIEAVVATTEAAPAAAPAAAPVPDKGDTTWMLVATVLVIFMSLPGLALFYGGLVRS